MRKLLLICVLILIFSVTVSAEDVSLGVNIKAENSKVNDILLLGANFDIDLQNGYNFNGYLGTDIDSDDDQFYTDLSILRKYSEEKNYYLGFGYRYIEDDSDGVKLNRNILYAKFVGKNTYNDYKLTTDISYSPYGRYEINGTGKEKMNSWFVELEIEKQLYDRLNFVFTTSYGYDEYDEYTTNVTSYSFGVNHDM